MKLFYKFNKSIRLEILFIVFISIVIGIFSYIFFYELIDNITTVPIVDYVDSINNIEDLAIRTFKKIEDEDISNLSKEEVLKKIYDFLSLYKKIPEFPEIEIVDLSGKIIMSTNRGYEGEYIDLGDVFDRINSQDKNDFEDDKYIVLNTFMYNGNLVYFIYSDVPKGKIIKISNSDGFVALLLGFFVVVIVFFYLTNKKMNYLFEIINGIEKISEGDLGYKIPELGSDELYKLANRVNFMSKSLKNKIELERAAENTKNELITNISHDLKTPLTSIIGYLTLIKDGKYKDEAVLKEYIDIVYSKSERLKKLILDLFEYTKISNVGYKLELDKIDLFDMVNQILEEYKFQFYENGLELKIDIEDTGGEFYGDASRLFRMFDNLLSNSLKYSEKNSLVEVKAFVTNNMFIFFVINETKNLNEDNIDRIFDRFYKADESRNEYGSGIGLAITKSIVKLHSGEITAHYNEGRIKVMVKLPL